MRSVYWVTVLTEEKVEPDDYDEVSGALIAALQTVFQPTDSLANITRRNDLTLASTEVEVKQVDSAPASQVVARAVFIAEAPSRVQLDKHRLSQQIKNASPFEVKVQKRAVPED